MPRPKTTTPATPLDASKDAVKTAASAVASRPTIDAIAALNLAVSNHAALYWTEMDKQRPTATTIDNGK